MNSLKYITFGQAEQILDARGTFEDGTVIVVEAAIIEARTRYPASDPNHIALTLIEHKTRPDDAQFFEQSPRRRVWGDGVYHYELLVARQGLEDILDANGDRSGFRVRGTNRGIW